MPSYVSQNLDHRAKNTVYTVSLVFFLPPSLCKWWVCVVWSWFQTSLDSVLLRATQTVHTAWKGPLDLSLPLFHFPRLFSHTVNSLVFLQNDVNRRRPVFLCHTIMKWETQECWRLSGFPPVCDRSLLGIFFPLKLCTVGEMVSRQKDPGIICVSTQYSEDSVERGRYTETIVSRPATHTRGARLAGGTGAVHQIHTTPAQKYALLKYTTLTSTALMYINYYLGM